MSKIIYLFSGQGSQYKDMGKQLFHNNQIFHESMVFLDHKIKALTGESVLDKVYADQEKIFHEMKYTHFGIFMIEYSLVMMLREFGIYPDYVVGTSMGEYVACLTSGILNLDEVLKILHTQTILIDSECENGSMLTVLDDISLISEIEKQYSGITLVSIDYDKHFVVSGSKKDIADLNQYLKNKKIATQLLDVNYAYHSPLIDVVEANYRQLISKIVPRTSEITYISGSTGTVNPVVDENYLWNIIRGKICFREAINVIEQSVHEEKIYIDLGPSSTLVNYLKKNLKADSNAQVFPLVTLYHNELDNLDKIIDYVEKNHQPYAVAFTGQGSQRRGIGKDILELPQFQEYLKKADSILGYSVKELCLKDSHKQLDNTAYSQPALYVVNCLSYLKMRDEKQDFPSFLLGHSLGEYCALFASGVVDFETGLRLVKKRGELMARENGGKMAAIVGIKLAQLKDILSAHGLADKIAFANYNEPGQTVLSGKKENIDEIIKVFEGVDGVKCVLLNVSGAFHSLEMQSAADEFSNYLNEFTLNPPQIPVIANYSAAPYSIENAKLNLTKHMVHAVRWVDSVEYLFDHGIQQIDQVGEGNVINRLVEKIKAEYQPKSQLLQWQEIDDQTLASLSTAPQQPVFRLGSAAFRQRLNLEYAHLAGPMNLGISSPDMVVRLAKHKMLGFISSSMISATMLKDLIDQTKSRLKPDENFGVGITYDEDSPENEQIIFRLVEAEKVRVIQLFNYIQMTDAYAVHRVKTLYSAKDTKPKVVIVKLSRPEIAELFMSPISSDILARLIGEGRITSEEAEWAKQFSAADAICIEAESGGYTEGKSLLTLLPGIVDMRAEISKRYQYKQEIFIGAAGGMGTPQAALCAFLLGADFIMTGSINVCTAEATMSEIAKEKLQKLDIQDTGYSPAIDFFEFGSKAQVMKKGSLFCTKARRLYELYRQFDSIEEIDDQTKEMLISRYFQQDIDAILQQMLIRKPQLSPDKKTMLKLVFQWYLIETQKYAIAGNPSWISDYQIYCSSAMGAFNRMVKGSNLERWQDRHVDEITKLIMDGAEALFQEKLLSGQKREGAV